MSIEEMPEGFPLKPIDNEGNVVKEGDTIRIVKIPAFVLAEYLTKEEVNDVMSCEGIEMDITEIDKYGFVWVEKILLDTEDEYSTHSFAIEPEHVTKITKTSNK